MLLGERINNKECYKMHLECAKQVAVKLSPFGAVCFDDTWFEEGKWAAKGATAVPYLIDNHFQVVMTGNNGVILIKKTKK